MFSLRCLRALIKEVNSNANGTIFIIIIINLYAALHIHNHFPHAPEPVLLLLLELLSAEAFRNIFFSLQLCRVSLNRSLALFITFLGASYSVPSMPIPPKAIACPTGWSGVAMSMAPDATNVPPPAVTAAFRIVPHLVDCVSRGVAMTIIER